MPAMPTTMLTGRAEEDGRRDCPAAAGGPTTRITGWVAQRTASSGCHRASPLREQRWPLVLEDQLVLRHGFVPADRPAPLPVMTMRRMRTTASKERQRRWPRATRERRSCASGRRLATQSSMIAGQRTTTKRASDKSKKTTNHCVLKAGEQRPVERAASNKKRKDNADEERTSEEEEDYNNNEEDDCIAAAAAAAAAAVTAPATAAATAGRHASSAATASDQEVAAVAAARRSGLRRYVVAAAADSRMPSLTPLFLCFLVYVCSTWHRIPCFMGPFFRNSGQNSGVRNSGPY